MAKEGFVNIHGKEYKTVAKRVQEFRETETYKGWSIMTEIVKIDDDQCVMKASVISPESKIIATGHGCEFKASSQINKTSYVENCETSAIGRALSAMNYQGSINGKPSRVTKEEMQKVERAEATLKEPTFTPDQVQLAMDALEQVPAIDSLAELKLFYTGAQEAGILTIPVQGKTLNAAVTARKKELEK